MKGNPGDTMWKRERRILIAAQLVGETCGEALAEKAGSFTCDEAEAIAALLDLFNSAFVADFRLIHAAADNEPSDRHHDGWA